MFAPDATEAEPGTTLTLPFQVRSDAPADLRPTVGLPTGWRLLVPEAPFRVSAGETETRLVTVVVPSDAAGEARVSYDVGAGPIDAVVTLATVRRASLSVPSLPEVLVDGAAVTVPVFVTNLGNTPLDVQVELTGASLSEPVRASVAPRATATLSATFVAPSGGGAEVGLEWRVVDVDGDTLFDRWHARIPRVRPPDARYPTRHELPGSVAVGAWAATARGEATAGPLVEAKATGSLDAAGHHDVDVLLRGPDAPLVTTRYLRDEYALRYTYDTDALRVTARAGDAIFRVHEMTLRTGRQRGVDVRVDRGALSAGAVAAVDRFNAQGRRLVGPTFGIRPAPGVSFDVTGLHQRKAGSDAWFGIHAGALARRDAKRSVDARYEVASGGAGFAGLATGAVRVGPVRVATRGEHATRGWAGDFAGRTLASADGRVSPSSAFNAGGSALYLLSRDPTSDAARRDVVSSADWQVAPSPTASVSMRWWGIDRSPVVGSGADSRDDRLVLTARWRGPIEVAAEGTARTRLDRPSDARFWSYRGSLTLARTAPWGRVAAQGGYQTNAAVDTSGAGLWFGSVNASWRAERTQGVVSYAVNHLTTGSTTHDARTNARLRVWREHEIALEGAITTSPAGQRTALVLSWVVPFRVPLARLPDSAAVRGRLVDADGRAVAGALVRLDDRLALVDDDGTFEFGGVAPGPHEITVPSGELPAGQVVAQPLPMSVDAVFETRNAPAPEVRLDVVQGGSVVGSVVLYRFDERLRDPGDQSPPPTVPDRGLAGLSVLARRGEEVRRAYTDGSGRFTFPNLPPGEWTVVVTPRGLPEDVALDGELTLTVAPGGEATASFKAMPRYRRVQFVEEGTDVIRAGDPATPRADATPVALTIHPESLTVDVGGRLNVEVIARWSDGTVRPVRSGATLRTANPDVATIGPDGVLVGHQIGATELTIQLGDLVRTVPVDVGDVPLVGLVASEALVLVPEGARPAIGVQAVDVRGRVSDVASQVRWTSSNAAVVTVIGGRLAAVGPGEAEVFAELGGIVTFPTRVVVGAIESLEVVSPVAVGRIGTPIQLTVRARIVGDGTVDLTDEVSWDLDPDSLGAISRTGVLLAAEPGVATARATLAGRTSPPLRIEFPAPDNLRIDGPTRPLTVGQTVDLTVAAEFRDGEPMLAGPYVQWSTSDSAVVEVRDGQLVAVGPGSATVTATGLGQTGTLDVRVAAP